VSAELVIYDADLRHRCTVAIGHDRRTHRLLRRPLARVLPRRGARLLRDRTTATPRPTPLAARTTDPVARTPHRHRCGTTRNCRCNRITSTASSGPTSGFFTPLLEATVGASCTSSEMTGVAATRQRLPRLIRLSEINPYPDTVLHAVTRTRTVVSYGRAAAGERRGLNVLHGRRVTESALARICLMAICDRGTAAPYTGSTHPGTSAVFPAALCGWRASRACGAG
jgi:hypothetical protein